ncbi:anti-repressor SinI family protein [Cytobacillus sp. FJAT-54145]|uniref:Anti-repressor SinI family protein n=1 Tax=Cytobacillus spartinae TaxID=3299023 RepID=A0ABW6KDT7_9BACI
MRKVNEKLDSEWIQLIKEAKTMGIDMNEIREFLEKRGDVEFSNSSYECRAVI